MKVKRADYIFLERLGGTGNHLLIEEYDVEPNRVVHIQQMIKTPKKRLDHKLLRILKLFWKEDTVVVGNERITTEWNMPNTLFHIKKQILLQNIKFVLEQLGSERGKRTGNVWEERKSFLLVLDSKEWRYKEVEGLLWEIRKWYEDMYIVVKKSAFEIDEIYDFFCEECGVILGLLEEEEAIKKNFDTIFFFVEREGRYDKSYSFGNRYMVTEWEENQFQSLLFVALNDTIKNSMKRYR